MNKPKYIAQLAAAAALVSFGILPGMRSPRARLCSSRNVPYVMGRTARAKRQLGRSTS